MVRDGLVFKDEDGQVIFNQYSFCEPGVQLAVVSPDFSEG